MKDNILENTYLKMITEGKTKWGSPDELVEDSTAELGSDKPMQLNDNSKALLYNIFEKINELHAKININSDNTFDKPSLENTIEFLMSLSSKINETIDELRRINNEE